MQTTAAGGGGVRGGWRCGLGRRGRIAGDAERDGLDAALGELRSLYGWPAPEDLTAGAMRGLAGREPIAEETPL
jgi:hypothetical protein